MGVLEDSGYRETQETVERNLERFAALSDWGRRERKSLIISLINQHPPPPENQPLYNLISSPSGLPTSTFLPFVGLETGSHYVAQPILQLTVPSSLCLLDSGIISVTSPSSLSLNSHLF